jgi:hypothetical protein
MAIHHHSIGDVVVIRDGFTKTATEHRTCTIVGILPATERGDAQYRVRFGAERCERRVLQADIDTTLSSAEAPKADTFAGPSGKPWLKPISARSNRSGA